MQDGKTPIFHGRGRDSTSLFTIAQQTVSQWLLGVRMECVVKALEPSGARVATGTP